MKSTRVMVGNDHLRIKFTWWTLKLGCPATNDEFSHKNTIFSSSWLVSGHRKICLHTKKVPVNNLKFSGEFQVKGPEAEKNYLIFSGTFSR